MKSIIAAAVLATITGQAQATNCFPLAVESHLSATSIGAGSFAYTLTASTYGGSGCSFTLGTIFESVFTHDIGSDFGMSLNLGDGRTQELTPDSIVHRPSRFPNGLFGPVYPQEVFETFTGIVSYDTLGEYTLQARGLAPYIEQVAIQRQPSPDVTITENPRTVDFGASTLITVTSVPEPETYALMLAGLGLMAWRARRV
jgi:hypothetical protein